MKETHTADSRDICFLSLFSDHAPAIKTFIILYAGDRYLGGPGWADWRK